jgi:hypothetical protein
MYVIDILVCGPHGNFQDKIGLDMGACSFCEGASVSVFFCSCGCVFLFMWKWVCVFFIVCVYVGMFVCVCVFLIKHNSNVNFKKIKCNSSLFS